MKKIHYNKLIRDKIPEIMKRAGVPFRITKLNRNQYRRELLRKVGEEASALPHCKNKEEITAELADAIDVIRAIQKEFRISDKQIRKSQKSALIKKGGFKKRLYLYWSEDSGYRTNERKYKK